MLFSNLIFNKLHIFNHINHTFLVCFLYTLILVLIYPSSSSAMSVLKLNG